MRRAFSTSPERNNRWNKSFFFFILDRLNICFDTEVRDVYIYIASYGRQSFQVERYCIAIERTQLLQTNALFLLLLRSDHEGFDRWCQYENAYIYSGLTKLRIYYLQFTKFGEKQYCTILFAFIAFLCNNTNCYTSKHVDTSQNLLESLAGQVLQKHFVT